MFLITTMANKLNLAGVSATSIADTSVFVGPSPWRESLITTLMFFTPHSSAVILVGH